LVIYLYICTNKFWFEPGYWHMKNTNILYKKLSNTSSIIEPAVVYSGLTLEMKTIFKDNKGKSGVYRLINVITGATYIGSAINLTRRFREYFSVKHLKKETLKNNSIIYRALLKNGYSNFRLEILEYCDKNDTIFKEQYYIDLLKPEYNICLKAASSLGRITREETRLKLRDVWLNRLYYRSKDSTLREFIINSIQIKLNESALKINKLDKELEKIKLLKESKVSYSTRMKILASTKTSEIVLITDTFKNVITKYPSARRAAEAIGVSNSTIMNKLKGRNTKLYKNRYLIKGLNGTQ
jgi:group I intron endonuclease